jgi:hypothetical protein
VKTYTSLSQQKALVWKGIASTTKTMNRTRFGCPKSALIDGWSFPKTNIEIEREAIRNANGRAFLNVHADMKGEDQAEMLVAALPKMLRILKANQAPFIARIYNPKKILVTSTEFRAHSKLSR